jgi:hypothetical protein
VEKLAKSPVAEISIRAPNLTCAANRYGKPHARAAYGKITRTTELSCHRTAWPFQRSVSLRRQRR